MSLRFKGLLWGLPFVFAALLVARTPLSPDLDLFLHLKSGQLISQAKRLPVFDQFTFTASTEREEVHSWLSQVLLFQVEKAGGEAGLKLFHFLLLSAILLILANAVNGATTFSAVALFFLVVQNSLLVLRPFLLGQVCFSLCAFILFPKRHWYLSLLMVTLWGNFHGSVLVAIPLLVFEVMKSGMGRRQIFFALSVGACVFLNPTNFGLLQSAIDLSLVGKKAGIWEWQGRDFAGTLSVATNSFFNASGVLINCFLVFGMGASIALWRKKNRNAFPLFIFCFAPFLATRHLAFAALPLGLLANLLPRIVKPIGIVSFLFLLCILFEKSPRDPFGDLKSAVEILKKQNYEGQILNFPGYGSYLIYEGYPQWKVLADRRLSVNRQYYEFENWMKKQFGGISVDLLTSRFPDAKMLVFHRAGIPSNLAGKRWRPLFEGSEVALWTKVPARAVDQITLR